MPSYAMVQQIKGKMTDIEKVARLQELRLFALELEIEQLKKTLSKVGIEIDDEP